MGFTRNSDSAPVVSEPSKDEAPKEKPTPAVTADSAAHTKATLQIDGEKAAAKDKSFVVAPGKIVMSRRGALRGVGVSGAPVGGDVITAVDCSRSRSPKDMERGESRLLSLIEDGHVVAVK